MNTVQKIWVSVLVSLPVMAFAQGPTHGQPAKTPSHQQATGHPPARGPAVLGATEELEAEKQEAIDVKEVGPFFSDMNSLIGPLNPTRTTGEGVSRDLNSMFEPNGPVERPVSAN